MIAEISNVRGRRRPYESGFTLVELGLVILIISLMAAFVVPKLHDTAHEELLSQARRLAIRMRHVREQAMLNGRTFRLLYDLDTHRYWLMSQEESLDSETFVPDDSELGKGINLPDPIGFSDVVLPFAGGKILEGVVFTDFYPDGYVDLTVVHIDNGKEAYTLRMDTFSGAVYLTEGYQDFDFGI